MSKDCGYQTSQTIDRMKNVLQKKMGSSNEMKPKAKWNNGNRFFRLPNK